MLAAPAVDDVDDAKAPADDEGAAKQRLDLLGRRVGRHVEVLGPQADQQIAYCAADDVGLKTRLLEHMHHIHRALVDQLDVDAVVLEFKVVALAERRFFDTRGGRLVAAGFAEQLVDEFFDHEM